MIYKVEFTPQAERDLSCIDKHIARNVANKIDWLSRNVERINPEQLKGEFKGKYKLRVGDWRIIYYLGQTSKVITVYAIKHRSKVYAVVNGKPQRLVNLKQNISSILKGQH